MAHNIIKPARDEAGFETSDHERVFGSPVALAFVRIVMARRSVTREEARRIHLDYINRTQPGRA